MSPHDDRRRRLSAVALLAAALLLATLAVVTEATRRGEREAVIAQLDDERFSTGERAQLVAASARDHQPDELRLDLAHRLVYAATTAATTGTGGTSAGHLDEAHQLAAEAFAERPAAWRAPMLLGTATYLARAARRERELVTASEEWDDPLTWSRQLAPASPEPARFTVLAYLELWPALSPEKRQTTIDLMRVTLDQPSFFGRLIEPWLTVADDRETAFSALPDRAWIWGRLERRYAKRGDWRAFTEVHERRLTALAGELEAQLDEAAALTRRDAWEGRRLYLQTIADAPRDTAFLPLVARALAEAPAGAPQPSLAEPLSRWLDWVLALSLAGGESPLPPEAVGRLAAAIPDLAPPLDAHAELAAGRLADGELIERRRFDAHPAWGGYLVVKARRLALADPNAALGALARADDSWRRRPSYLVTLADAARAEGDDATADAAEGALAALPAVDWTGDANRASIEAAAPTAARGFSIDGRAAGEVMVTVRLDGRTVETRRAGRRGLRVETEVAPGLHLVEVETIAGNRFEPARLSWLPAAR
ncbi:MAG TPA: hypothetical protein VKU40_12030 [Thermoanaerobaculia bacterium]|nr:hypothetical protein [Thermoanaerobaculia bacterium]